MKEPIPMIHLYMGKRLDEMTREELINAVINLGTLYKVSLERFAGDIRVLSGQSRE